MKHAVNFDDGLFADARDAALHQSAGGELPVLVAIGAEPIAAVVMVFTREAYGDAVIRTRPFSRPLAFEESIDRVAAGDEFRAVSPLAIFGIGECDPGRIAAVPGILGQPGFLRGGIVVERGSGGRLISMFSVLEIASGLINIPTRPGCSRKGRDRPP